MERLRKFQKKSLTCHALRLAAALRLMSFVNTAIFCHQNWHSLQKLQFQLCVELSLSLRLYLFNSLRSSSSTLSLSLSSRALPICVFSLISSPSPLSVFLPLSLSLLLSRLLGPTTNILDNLSAIKSGQLVKKYSPTKT